MKYGDTCTYVRNVYRLLGILTVLGLLTIGTHPKLSLLNHVPRPLVLIIGIRWVMDIVPMQLTVKDTSIICNERWEQECATDNVIAVDSITEQRQKKPWSSR